MKFFPLRSLAVSSVVASAICASCATIAGVRDDLEFATADGAVAPVDGSTDARVVSADGSTCREGETVCSGACVRILSDPSHCGGCNIVCKAGEVCDRARCRAGGCSTGLSNCSGACVDLASDPNHCGTCTRVCASNETCISGSCQRTTTGSDGGTMPDVKPG